jgi:Ca2+/H+ antiporter, TMEM165/GDT1 family
VTRFPFLVSLIIASAGELGDKSQLVVLLLAGVFEKPVPIILGALCANLLNNTLSVLAGGYFRRFVSSRVLRPILAVVFFALAWLAFLKASDAQMPTVLIGLSPLLATMISYLLADMGDKTQLATVALAATYQAPLALIAGSTLGGLIVDLPTILLAGTNPPWARANWVHCIFAAIFVGLGVITLLSLRNQRLGRFVRQ